MVEARSAVDMDIGDHALYPGRTVNVRWKGSWYEGTAIRLGPQWKLCKITDIATNESILCEPSSLKLLEAHALDQSLSPGTHVAYYDCNTWMEGIVESNTAVGAAKVKWKRSAMTDEEEGWFEMQDLAPIIYNEAFDLEMQVDKKVSSHRINSHAELLQVDPINPQPRSVENVLYESESEKSENGSPHSHQKQFQMSLSPTYESVATQGYIPSPALPPPNKFSNSYPVLGPNRPFVYNNKMKRGPSVLTTRSSFYPYRYSTSSDMGPNIMSLPHIFSAESGGIPPHPSSRFFKKLFPVIARKQHHFPMSASSTRVPSVRSKLSDPTVVEPTPYAEIKFPPPVPLTIPEEPQAFQHEQHRKGGSASPKRRSLAKSKPNPYEVPRLSISSDLGQQFDLKQAPTALQTEGIPEYMEEAGSYSGMLTGTGGPVIHSASPSNVRVQQGGSTLLSCITRSKPTASYMWYKDGEELEEDGKTIAFPAPGMLQIDHASSRNAGDYMCIISNIRGTVSFHCSVEVVAGDKEVGSSGASNSSSKVSVLKTGFANKVTYEELDVESPAHLHEMAKPEENPAQRLHDDDDEEVTINLEEGDKDVKEAKIPTILLTREKRTTVKERRRTSNVLSTDLEQYLEGYGEDYGALSSATDLDMEGLDFFDLKELTAERFKGLKGKVMYSPIKEEPVKSRPEENEAKKEPEPEASMDLRIPKLFNRRSKSASAMDRIAAAQTVNRKISQPKPDTQPILEKPEHETVIHVVGATKGGDDTQEQYNQAMSSLTASESSADSVAVNTSLDESSSSEQYAPQEEQHEAPLSLEVETLDDRLSRFKQDIQSHAPPHLTQVEKKKKALFPKIFGAKNKPVSTQA